MWLQQIISTNFCFTLERERVWSTCHFLYVFLIAYSMEHSAECVFFVVHVDVIACTNLSTYFTLERVWSTWLLYILLIAYIQWRSTQLCLGCHDSLGVFTIPIHAYIHTYIHTYTSLSLFFVNNGFHYERKNTTTTYLLQSIEPFTRK